MSTRRGSPTVVDFSVPFDPSGTTFNPVTDNVHDALVEAKQNSEGFPRAAIGGAYNGTVSNNQWLGPSELLPNTPLCIFPVNTKLNEITWSNQTADVSFNVELRTVSKTGTIFYTLSVVSPNLGYGYVNGLNIDFAAGTAIFAQYKDTGTNCADMRLDLWISRNP
jgi:hypothetical protein